MKQNIIDATSLQDAAEQKAAWAKCLHAPLPYGKGTPFKNAPRLLVRLDDAEWRKR